jgi:hypothetical protein
MKIAISKFAILLLATAGLAWADLPKKAPLSRYSNLWTNSPFTSKPPPLEGGIGPNPLDDYALIGVSPIGVSTTSGNIYRVTLINKKKPDERIIVDSDKAPKDGLKIIEVIRKSGDPLGTTVRMNSGSMTGTVAFESKLLTLAQAPKAPPGVPGQLPKQIQPGQPVQPGQPGQPTDPALRQPRPRVVPPPLPQVNAQAQPAQPTQPAQLGQPSQPIPQANQNLRPTRRGN